LSGLIFIARNLWIIGKEHDEASHSFRLSLLVERSSMSEDRMVRVRAVTPLTGFRVKLSFTDGSEKEIDLEPYLRGPIFDQIRHDQETFRAVRVDARSGTIVWENGADIDPDVLYQGLSPAWMDFKEEVA
jgi:hypothetical protein